MVLNKLKKKHGLGWLRISMSARSAIAPSLEIRPFSARSGSRNIQLRFHANKDKRAFRETRNEMDQSRPIYSDG